MRKISLRLVLRKALALALFLVCYVLSSLFVLRHLSENGVVAVFWPPSGIALAALLVTSWRFLPIIFFAAFTANTLAEVPINQAWLYAAVNTVEGSIAWWLLTRLKPIDTSLTKANDFFRIFLLGALIAPTVGAILGAMTISVGNFTTQTFWQNFQYWWMGDSLGVIVLTPLLLVWRAAPRFEYTVSRWVEAVLVLALAVLIGQVVLTGSIFTHLQSYGRAFMLFIFVTWAAVRFGRHATALLITIITLQTMAGIAAQKGYFFTPNRDVTFSTVWLYLTAISVTGMSLAIYIHEARFLQRNLVRASERLEQVTEIAKVGGWEFDVLENKMRLSRETLRMLELPEDAEIDLEKAYSFIDEVERLEHEARGKLAIEQGIGWDVEFALRTNSGRRLWVRSQGKPIEENGRVVRLVGALQDLTEWQQSQQALKKRELEFRRLVETASEGIWTIDANGITTFVNKRMAEMLGYAPQEMLGRSFLHYIPNEQREEALKRLNQRKQGISEIHESTLLHRSGKIVHVLANTSPIQDDTGKVIGALAMMTDITERKFVEQQLKLSEARYRELVDSMIDAIIVHQSGFIVYANEAAFQLVGAKHERDLIGRNALDFVAPEYREIVLERMKQVNRPGGFAPLVEEQFLRLDGSRVYVEVSGRGITFNGVPATMVVARDITDRKRAEEQIRYLGQHDLLTGLPNRALFADRLSQAIAIAERHQSIFALLFVDLDHFKRINDSYGHRAGDEFLKHVAHRLKGSVRAIDTVFRQGGDEFIILLSEITHAEDAGLVARKICDRLAEPFNVDNLRLHASASVGIAVYPKDGNTSDILLRNADIAMYHAKSRGRNQYQFFSEELNQIIQKKLEIETSVRRALEENQFHWVYQPQLNLQTGAIETLEALVRWRHPTKGELLPQDFISITEDTGVIVALGEHLFEKALQDLQKIDAAGHKSLRLAINVSITQLRDETFAESVLQLLEQYGQSPSRIELEVTESMLMHEKDTVFNTMKQLSDAGIQFVVDDFGTGYSSLRYLKDLKIKQLKIARNLVSDLTKDKEVGMIVKTIIALAQNLGLKTIAEGVETPEQRDFLRNHGCELMQGYLYSPPLEILSLLSFLSAANR